MRMGMFSRVTQDYGPSLGVVKPPDNNPGSYIPSQLNDPSLKLTEMQRQDLAQRIHDLFNMYQGEQQYYP